jgi:hypothetical protein
MLLDAVVTAGGDPDKDADLLAYGGNAPVKALIEVEGRTLLEWVTLALLGSGRVRRIAVVGLPPQHYRDLGPQVTFLPDAGGMLENGMAGAEHFKSSGEVSERIVASSSDIPLVTPDIVRDLVDECLSYDVDLCYTVVGQETMERAFPGSGRTFVPMADGRFAGGDIVVAKLAALDANRQQWRELIGSRKKAWKQVRIIGLGTLLLFLLRRLTVAAAERRGGKALGLTVKAVISSHAEVAMDVDKPHHLDIVRAALAHLTSEERDG